jgi:hypothetical protein
MERWTRWCYDEESCLLYAKDYVMPSSSGTQQGDPLGPLYFCSPLLEIIEAIQARKPDYNKWYMDDGGIIGDVEMLEEAWDILKTMGPPLGMVLNPAKCEWSWLDESCDAPCPIKVLADDGSLAHADLQVRMVPTSNIEMLGVPLGSAEFNRAYVKDSLMNKGKVLEVLIEFNDIQSALFILRSSYGITRATHFMRTTPLPQWKEEAAEFDRVIRSTAENILGFPFTERAYRQVSTSSSVGGLNLRQLAEHADVAYAASNREAAKESGESWAVRPEIEALKNQSQRKASQELDKAAIDSLKESGTKRQAAHLEHLQYPHANAWVAAVPSYTDGNDMTLEPKHFLIAVKRLLSLPLIPAIKPCPFCKQPLDTFGDHALCCKKSGDNITRHNRVRNLLKVFCEEGLLSPVMEKLGILGHEDNSSRRPGDVTIPVWTQGKGLAIDVAVIHPLAASNLRFCLPYDEYGEAKKHARVEGAFAKSNYLFSALICGTSGGLNYEGEHLLKQIFRFAARHQGERLCVYAGQAWARLSINIQQSVSQMIINRI